MATIPDYTAINSATSQPRELFLFPCNIAILQVAQTYHNHHGFLWFDSARDGHLLNRFSYVMWGPEQVKIFEDGEAFESHSFPCYDCRPPGQNTIKILNSRDDLHLNPTIFLGGWAGYWAYDLGESLESKLRQMILPLGKNRAPYPLAQFGFYTQFFIHDHGAQKTWFGVYAVDETAANNLYQNFESDLLQSHRKSTSPTIQRLSFYAQITRDEYLSHVEKIIDLIFAGEVFQANFAQQFCASTPKNYDPFAAYLNLRVINPAPYAAYMNWGDLKILSASPESFLEISSNGHAVTRPIKGTAHDLNSLKHSEKDRAENLMIVDLMRNDFSKICDFQSVTVEKIFEIQKFAGLYHLVSEVHGNIAPKNTSLSLLKSCFPGGSITGAPKIRAMEIIAQHECFTRGVYCGSLGWVGIDGALQTNIAIRTLTHHQNTMTFCVGGGITACSNAAAEYAETRLKAQKIFEALGDLSAL
ncbi:MAG: anthranilate synthase component I family protein [Alphaproteobacteria bacterium]|nr:anthranilate synthase component I family protein [Alphaproteobacteria bacterium]